MSELRPAFSDLLRQWRKSRNLSQWALSDTAGVSQRHLSFLESGRSAPSRGMVLRLAESLAVPLREQNALLAAAGFAPAIPETPLDADELKQARQAVDLLLHHHEPFPAALVDRNWNFIEGNNGVVTLFSLFLPADAWERVGSNPPNVIQMTLHPEGLARYIEDFDGIAGNLVGRLDDELRHNPCNPFASALLEEVLGYTGVSRPERGAEPLAPCLRFTLDNGTHRVSLFSMVTTFGTPLDVTLQELRVEAFFPADAASETLLRSLAASA